VALSERAVGRADREEEKHGVSRLRDEFQPFFIEGEDFGKCGRRGIESQSYCVVQNLDRFVGQWHHLARPSTFGRVYTVKTSIYKVLKKSLTEG
jgi:hypothetical protein